MAQHPHAFLTLHLCMPASVTVALVSWSHKAGRSSFALPHLPHLVGFTQETP